MGMDEGLIIMGKYNKQIRILMPPATFYNKLADLVNPRYRAYNILLYYLGCRCSEGLNLTFEDISFDPSNKRILIQVHRLKKSKQTPPNPLYLDSPFVKELSKYLLSSYSGKIFDCTRKTGYNMVKTYMGFYPHYYRMNRISQFVESGSGITDIQNWFGITVNAIDYYLVDKQLKEMGRGLK